nr:YetF domain-containing protein [Bacillus subtilis]
MDRKLLTKNKLDVNQVLSILRQNNVFSVREVKYGILEDNGQISIKIQVSKTRSQSSRKSSRPPNIVNYRWGNFMG